MIKGSVLIMNVEGIVAIIYVIAGMIAVKYIKTNIFGVVAEITPSLWHSFIKNLVFGAFLGFIAIPVALIHWIIMLALGKNR